MLAKSSSLPVSRAISSFVPAAVSASENSTSFYPCRTAQVAESGPAALETCHVDFGAVFQRADDIVSGFGRTAYVQGLSVFRIHIHGSETKASALCGRKGNRRGPRTGTCPGNRSALTACRLSVMIFQKTDLPPLTAVYSSLITDKQRKKMNRGNRS